MPYFLPGLGIAQYSDCSAGWTTEGSQFGSHWCRDFASRVKRPRLEANLSSPYNTEVKNMWSFTFVAPCVLRGVWPSYCTLNEMRSEVVAAKVAGLLGCRIALSGE